MPRSPSAATGRHRQQQRWCAAGGFTLLEVLVVFVILALVASAMPLLVSPALPGIRLTALAQELASDLRLLRTTAINSMQETALSISQRPPGWIAMPGRTLHVLPDGVRIGMAADDADATPVIRFAPDGASNGGAIWLENGSTRRTITVAWLTGRVHVAR